VWESGNDGNAHIIVCVTDTGVDATHPDLAGNLWTNSHEIAGNHIDDDGNGIVDDVHGVQFINGVSSNVFQDDNGHGTQVHGIIGAIANNTIGTAGVAPQVALLPC
jgi:subtilisin family serine protease